MELFGLMHGGQTKGMDMFGNIGWSSMDVTPSYELIAALRKFNRIGIETVPQISAINQDITIKSIEAGIPNKDIQHPDMFIEYYWKNLIDGLSDSEIVFLERPEDYLAINEASVRMNVLGKKGDWIGVYDASLELRRIQELVKHDLLLERLDGLDAVVVGVGHSDVWMSRPKVAKRFSRYSVEQIDYEERTRRVEFLSDTVPDDQNLFVQEGLRRCLEIKEHGHLLGEEPDYTGTWDFQIPAQGYFEMFVDFEKGKAFKGRIIDCNGDAIFSGVKKKKFVKLYDEEFRIPEAASYPITFNIEKGIYFDRGFVMMDGRRSVDELTRKIASLVEK